MESINNIDSKVLSDFKTVCNMKNTSIEDALETMIKNYVDNFKSNQANVSLDYNKMLVELLGRFLNLIENKSKNKELESLSLEELFGGVYDRDKIQMFDRLNQFRKCKDDLSVSIDRKQYLIDEFVYYTISKYIIDALVMSKKDIIERFNSIE